ncbi:hypothetical protein N7U66_14985 [Lacinutrix neustonica]|uniref:FAD dependent oxidoreductase domain-containing protein n=1 Tax=Lacinutrix neustonica TaxID=2980107 RepID=A0A9E8MUW3_9FLAO|nr:hypothetical protein [Lacinutrix neustonica]WAC01359.1 hypothetical protein N7U66_14985 [Lacinutrix neustonica]
MPYIGKSLKCKNLTIATGHAMMGWSMATATGLLVSEIISDKKTSLDIKAFHPRQNLLIRIIFAVLYKKHPLVIA